MLQPTDVLLYWTVLSANPSDGAGTTTLILPEQCSITRTRAKVYAILSLLVPMPRPHRRIHWADLLKLTTELHSLARFVPWLSMVEICAQRNCSATGSWTSILLMDQ